MVQNSGPLLQKWFEVAGTVCKIPDEIQHDLGDFQVAIDDIDKYGWLGSVGTGSDPATVWSVGGLHPGVLSVTISGLTGGADDTLAGSGAQIVEVIYLKDDWSKVTENIDMAGASLAPFANEARAVDRMEVIQWGGSGPNVANINATIGGTTVARIDAGAGQTGMAWYVIPTGHTAYLLRWYAFIGRNASAAYAEVHFKVRKWAARGAMNAGVIKRHGLLSTQGNKVNDRRPIAETYPARTVVWIDAFEVSATVSVSAGFDMLVLPNI